MIKAKYNRPKAGWPNDQEQCRKLLTLNQMYDVCDIDVHSWHTDIYLDGFGAPFNSVNFTYYDENGNKIELSDTEEWKRSDARRGCW